MTIAGARRSFWLKTEEPATSKFALGEYEIDCSGKGWRRTRFVRYNEFHQYAQDEDTPDAPFRPARSDIISDPLVRAVCRFTP